MTYSNRQTIANNNLRKYFKIMGKRYINSIAINRGNTRAHELKKAEVAIDLMREGNIIATELVTLKGDRPDVVVLDVDPPICYEIVHSEKQESIDNKIKKYSPLRIVVVKSNEGIKS